MKKVILFAIVIGVMVFVYFRQQNENYYDLLIVSGATPLAVSEKVPLDVSLTVDGLVKKEYRFSGSALNGFATTRIRTREFSPEGKYLGAYAYLGIPVYNIMEGIAPEKPPATNFDQPLDMLVTFISGTGKTARFSFNEIIMTDDRSPITLAYHRKQILPTTEKVRDTYRLNRYPENVSGLRLICPREPDTSRYLDDVVRITYSVLPAPDGMLPPRQRGTKCASTSITCVQGDTVQAAQWREVAEGRNDRWARIGHGHGFEDVSRVAGHALSSFLRVNFPDARDSDFFLFVACDGYRCLFSGREIFSTRDGQSMLITRSLNDSALPEGYMLVPTADFFHDRAMWGLAHVVRIDPTVVTPG